MGNCFSRNRETFIESYGMTRDESNEANSGDVVLTVTGPSGGFFTGAHEFSVSHSQLMEVHGNYYVRVHCH